MNIMLWLLLMTGSARLIDTPTTWTADPAVYEEMVAPPTATGCDYWGAHEVKGHCEAYLVLGSSPRGLHCRTDERYSNVVLCRWDKPKRGVQPAQEQP